jgi:hypothetical protein
VGEHAGRPLPNRGRGGAAATVQTAALEPGRRHAGQHVRLLVHELHVRVITEDGELLRELVLDPTRDYQPQA